METRLIVAQMSVPAIANSISGAIFMQGKSKQFHVFCNMNDTDRTRWSSRGTIDTALRKARSASLKLFHH